jgi:zinc finger protein 830
VDDDVWAAFEADLVHGANKSPAVAGFANSEAIISAPAMSAAELAAKSEEEDQEKRRTLADIQIEDEKEDATRALETEFEIMEELEARAKKLRERREALRRQSVTEATATVPDKVQKGPALGKENSVVEEDEEDEDEDEDDWVGFRFRG